MYYSESHRSRLWVMPALMLLGGVAGIIAGSWFGPEWKKPEFETLALSVRLLGTIFLSLLKALIVPLIVTSILSGVRQLGASGTAARLAGGTAVYFLTTTALAVLTGLFLVQLIHPGAPGGAILTGASPAVKTSGFRAIVDLITGMFPSNLVQAAVEGNVLGLVVFSLILGAALAKLGSQTRVLQQALDGLNHALLAVVRWVVWLAPIGIFGLVADRLGQAGGGDAAWIELRRLGAYALTVLLGLAIHALITLPATLALFGRRNPARYAAGMAEALVTAFGTASSAATMAVTLRAVTERNRVSAQAADIVIPVGTTVNMDGTALYEAVAVVFIAQSMGIELGFVQLLLVALTATLAAVGAAAIPEAGLVTMVLVLQAVGLPAESVGLLLSIDWILDRFRTAVNVWGDSVGAAIIDRQLLNEAPAMAAAVSPES
ncbi:MAG TPA: dicarboxylate/amino acid:cation symporter [Terriglobia bacterium]|nr:dicarboxylate/amino acid:cation symporter [Terriglobia bacterium]